jgi:hypothetical protein
MMKFHQHRKPVKHDSDCEMVFSEIQKKFMLRGRDVTREQLLSGKKVGEGRPVPYKTPCPFYVLYDNEVFLIDKGYEQFVAKSLEEFLYSANTHPFVELNPGRWVDHEMG